MEARDRLGNGKIGGCDAWQVGNLMCSDIRGLKYYIEDLTMAFNLQVVLGFCIQQFAML